MSASPSSFGRAFCADIALAVLVAACAGCARSAPSRAGGGHDGGGGENRDAARPEDVGGGASEAASEAGANEDARLDGAADALVAAHDAWSNADDSAETLQPYLTRAPRSGTSVGHTSLVYRLRLEGGLEAAFKPRSRRGGTRYQGEIAAYRLAAALGLSNVPPALPRAFDEAALRTALGESARGVREIVAEESGEVRGAILPWIKGLAFVDLEKDPWRARWESFLLRDGPELGDEDRRMAADISTMIVFDYVTGNWDRWSGGNVGRDPVRGTLLFIDNDGAFYETPPAGALAKQRALLERVRRFSRRFTRALREVTLADAIGEEAPGVALVGPRTLASVDARRRVALQIVDAKIAAGGDGVVLAFE